MQKTIEIFPLTSTQRGILAESLLPHERGIYVEQIVGELDEPLDIDHFRSAWQHTMRAFDALRLALNWTHGTAAKQTITASAEVPFHVEDFRQHPETQSARIEEFIKRDRLADFDLGAIPLLRVSVLLFDDSKWAFVWTIHHSIIDGGSYAIVLQYVFDSYERLSSGRSPGAVPGPPFEAFLKWLQEYETTAGVSHFEELLNGFHEPTRLPLQYGRSELRTRRSDEVHFRLEPLDSQVITAAARDTGTTVNTLVQFAWGLLLSRYADEDDVVFGATWSGRPGTIDGAELLVGPCINTLPIRINLADASTVRSALQTVRDQHLTMRPFQHTPLHALKLAPRVGRPIFRTNVVFEYERFDAVLRRKDERWNRRKIWSRSQTNYLLNLSAYFDKDELVLDLEYSVSLYNARAANRLLMDYTRLLNGIAHGLDVPPTDLCLLESGVSEALTMGEARREEVRPHPNPIERILRNDEECPEAVAVSEMDGRSLTYAELAGRVFGLADELREHGVAERDLIGIFLPRSIDAIVAMLAIHAVGAAFLPLDPGDPAARLEYLVGDSKVACLLVNGQTAGTLKGAADLELRVDLRQNARRGARSLSVPNPSDIAYVIYTSGSTGQPKGVCIPYSALSNHVASVIEHYGLSKEDRVLQFSPLSFDVSLEEILPTLSVGALLMLRSDEMTSSTRNFFDIAERSAVTVLNLPTAFWHYLAHAGQAGSWPSKVRLLIVGGERVSATDLRTFRQAKTEHIRFLNGYGPTETTITSTLYDDSEGDHDNETVPIGRPLDGYSHFVLDRHLRPMPPGTVGQLYIGGAGLALGYLRQQELTEERFLAHPFRADARLYATGDLVRRTERGNYVFVDRIDHQIKLRGFRIELGEIEACLKQHAGVTEAVVVLHHPAGREPELRGFVVARDQAVSAGALHEHVAAALPRHLVPRLFIVDELPKTPAGKIDRPALSVRDISYEVTPPSSTTDPLERQLLQIWSDLLETPVTDTSTTFFEAGGHSLLVLQMLCEVEVRLNRTCDAHTFLANPTVKCLAGLLDGEGGAGSAQIQICLSSGRPHLRPLFLAPGLLGQSSEYGNLAKALHPDIPVYGLQPGQICKSDNEHHDLAEAARHYAAEIRKTQPVGPYSIAGYSAGGIVALAIAQALHAGGEKTDFVGLIDSTPPASVSIPPPFTSLRRSLRLCRTIADRFREMLTGPHVPRLLWARTKSAIFRSLASWFPFLAWRKQRVDDLFIGISGDVNPEEIARMQLRLEVILSYEPKQDPIDVILLRTLPDPFEGPHEPDLGWGRAITGKVTVEHLPGPHEKLLTGEGAKSLARALERYLLSRAQGKDVFFF
jgi:amino acid adenylation domain-containing protein